MATTVKIRRSGTATATPSSLEHGEIAINYADGKVFWKDASNVITSFTFQSYALASHTHAASDITSGTLDIARIPTGSTSSTVCIGDDARLSDTRTPTDGTVSTAKLADAAVTYAKIQNVSTTDRLLGRSTAGAGVVEEITCTAFGRSLIDDADAATARTTLGVQPTASPAFTGSMSLINSGASDNSTIRYGNSGQDWYVGLRGDTSNAFAIADSVAFRLTISSTGTATFAGQILADDIDTANSVAYGFDGDADTGVGRGGANVLTLVTNGTERVRVDASGKVGIGTGSPGQSLHVFGGENWLTNTNFSVAGGTGTLVTIYTGASTGNTYGAVGALTGGAGAWGDLVLQQDGGSVLIGTTSNANATYKLQVNSQIYATNATIATSDARFKTNVQSLADATSVIESLRPVAFDFIPQEDRNFAAERQVGLIAQEALAALAGTDYADSVVAQCGDHLGLAYEKLVPVLIRALQESNARIAALEERLSHG